MPCVINAACIYSGKRVVEPRKEGGVKVTRRLGNAGRDITIWMFCPLLEDSLRPGA